MYKMQIERYHLFVISIFVLFIDQFNGGHCHYSGNNKKSDRYLSHIFHKYGSHGTLSFEGFEHLMYNLGLGGLEFNPSHTLDEHRPSGFYVPELIIDDDFDFTHHDHPPSDPKKHIAEEVQQTHDSSSSVLNVNTTNQINVNADSDYQNKPENVFKVLHDPLHRHPRHHDHGTISMRKCLSPLSIIQLYVPPSNRSSIADTIYKASAVNDPHAGRYNAEYASQLEITPDSFLKLCPALIAQIEEGSCKERLIAETEQKEGVTGSAWLAATVSVTIISLCGLVGIAIVPLTKFGAYHQILKFLIACAVGTLCGDALMHLLPHALIEHSGEDQTRSSNKSGHGHDAEVKAVLLCGCAFLAALAMYSIEALLSLSGGHGHSHNHSHEVKRGNVVDVYEQSVGQGADGAGGENGIIASNSSGSNGTIGGEETDVDMEISKKNTEEKVMVKDSKNKVRPEMSAVAFIVVIGDGLHNLTDGMAIGAAFGTDPVTGMATALAVLCHELPHELGDFALLLQTGVSIRRAIFLNIVSSILSFIGMFIGLFVVRMNTEFVRWIYAGTSGTFLYIALADLVPELGKSQRNLNAIIIQIFGIFLGGVIMLVIALNEESLKLLFK